MFDLLQADSGGPVMQLSKDRWVLAGIISTGDKICSGIGVYTNVSNYVDWINQNIQ